jgi:glucose dehydrogenase
MFGSLHVTIFRPLIVHQALANPDADFGEAPLMLSIKRNKTKIDIVAAVQKSGFAWALDRNNGNLIWYTVS